MSTQTTESRREGKVITASTSSDFVSPKTSLVLALQETTKCLYSEVDICRTKDGIPVHPPQPFSESLLALGVVDTSANRGRARLPAVADGSRSRECDDHGIVIGEYRSTPDRGYNVQERITAFDGDVI